MSLAIASATVARLAACTCGTCAACAPRPVMQAVAVPVAEPATRATRDSYEPSTTIPPVAGQDDEDAAGAGPEPRDGAVPAGHDPSRSASASRIARDPASGPQQLSPDERRMVAELQARDREVRAHEAAHQAAGGGHVGGASYSYQQGPDGRQYAIGGEVPVDLSTGGGSPEAVIAKMAQVRAAAMAPADPSPQDFAVAAAAAAIAAAARQEQRAAQEREAVEGPAAAAGAAPAGSGGTVTPPVESPETPADRRGGRNAGEPAGTDGAGGEPDTGAIPSIHPQPEPLAGGPRPPDEDRRATRAMDAYRAAQAGGGLSALIDQRA